VSFRAWLRQFRREESAIGDLARDALADQEWPRGPGSLNKYLGHLEDVGACDAAIDTLHEAWARYERERES
jgi:uncharacterized protein YozE (UPF0346 family)